MPNFASNFLDTRVERNARAMLVALIHLSRYDAETDTHYVCETRSNIASMAGLTVQQIRLAQDVLIMRHYIEKPIRHPMFLEFHFLNNFNYLCQKMGCSPLKRSDSLLPELPPIEEPQPQMALA